LDEYAASSFKIRDILRCPEDGGSRGYGYLPENILICQQVRSSEKSRRHVKNKEKVYI
jgi:hypothetical protein